MDIESFFTEAKWNILTELAKSPLSPGELAKRTNTSLANISIQMRLLEAMDFVEQVKSTDKTSSARKIYSLKKPICYLTLASPVAIGKKMIPISDDTMIYFSVWFLKDENAPQLMLKAINLHDTIRTSESIGYIGLKGETLEILVLNKVKTEFNEIILSCLNKNYTLNIHSFSVDEFVDGFNNRDEQIVSLVKKANVLKDKDNRLSILKKGGK